MSHPIKAAIEKLGSQKALADALSVSPSFVSQCLTGHRKMPVDHCRRIEELTGGLVTREHLRPDIFCADSELPGDGSKAA